MESWNKMDSQKKIGVVVIAAIILIGGFLLFRNFTSSPSDEGSATISGTFNINGVAPEGATITIYGSEYDSSKGDTCPTNVAAEGLPATDGSSWSFSNLTAGTTYIACADIIADGKTISSSDHFVVTAPASNEEVVFNIETINGEANAEISGNVIVHGYIPEGSTITFEGRVHGTRTYTVAAEGIPAKQNQKRVANNLIEGESYDIVGVLYDENGVRIGESDPLVVTAPAVNEILVINSSATPPSGGNGSPTPAKGDKTISGTIDFNGQAPSNSRIVVFQKTSEQSDYQVAVDNIEPVDGATWSWDKAVNGTWYDMKAVLKQIQSNNTDKDIASSAKVSVAAPATGVSLTINSSVSIPAPTKQISLQCISQSGDSWNSTITIPYVVGAQTYWYQVGTSNGSNDVANATVAANGNNDVQVNLSLTNQRTFYFRYAYANVADVGVGNAQFSPFSSTSQGSCGF
jgi:hypothetical protein